MKYLTTLLIFLGCGVQAATTYTEFYVQTTASNLNAGSTTADASALTYTNSIFVNSWDSSTGVFIVGTGNPSGDGVAVGDWASIYVTSGATVATFVSRVTARTTTNITVSLTAVAGSPPTTDALGARTLKIGGAWKGPNAAVGFPFGFTTATLTNTSGNVCRVNFKSGTTYSITAAMTHSITGPIVWSGYTSSVGDGGKATIDGGTSGTSYTLLTLSGINNDLSSFIFSNNGATGAATALYISGSENVIHQCVVHDVRGSGFRVEGTMVLSECEAYLCNAANSSDEGGYWTTGVEVRFVRCIAHDNSGSNNNGFSMQVGGTCLFCISDSNGNDGFRCFAGVGNTLIGCDSYNNGGDGVDLASSGSAYFYIENCNFFKNTGFGINSSVASTVKNGRVFNCVYGTGTQTNSGGNFLSTIQGVNIPAATLYATDDTPWTAPTTGDFTTKAGATTINSGRGTFTQTQASYTGTLSYPDIGSTQITNSAAGGAKSFLFVQ